MSKKIIDVIPRSACAVSGEKDLEILYNLSDFPVFMGCVNSPEPEDLVSDMIWAISRSSGLIQLSQLIPLEILYRESHGSGGIGRIWDLHHDAFAKFLSKVHPMSVLEIGGAHGILSKKYKPYGLIPWTILEPNPAPIEGCDARYIKGFFDQNFTSDCQFDAVVHSHVFEHIYEPNQFMHHLALFIKEGKSLVFSLPNMRVMLKNKFSNCLNFEHTIFLSETYIDFLLNRYGFKLLAKEYFMDNHSIFYAAVRELNIKPTTLPQDLYIENRKLYLDYIEYYKTHVIYLNEQINFFNEPVYLFGAHIFAQNLIHMGLNTEKINCLLDNDTQKHGRRLYGTKLSVASPKVLADIHRPIVILNAGVYNDEIKLDIVENINKSVRFIE